MSRDLAIIAGSGALPELIHGAFPEALVLRPDMSRPFQPLLDDLIGRIKAAGCSRVVLAGNVPRPLTPDNSGDAALSHYVAALLELAGLQLVGADQLLPELTARPGHLAGPGLSASARCDAMRGRAILDAVAVLDIGQAVVVVNGICLGIETAQGTDALLRFVAQSAELHGPRGVLVKAPKTGQDLRIDMPAIGPETVRLAAAAGLEAIVIAAGSVLILERTETLARSSIYGLCLHAEPL